MLAYDIYCVDIILVYFVHLINKCIQPFVHENFEKFFDGETALRCFMVS